MSPLTPRPASSPRRFCSTLPPDEFFDRQWALAVARPRPRRARTRVRRRREGEPLRRLKPWLAGAAAHGDQAAAARTLGLSEGALKVAMHRLRLRFRAFVKAEVAQTLDASDPVEDELQQLFIALGC